MGQLLEAMALDDRYSNQDVAEWFNQRYGYTEDGAVDQDWAFFESRQIKNHVARHLTGHMEVYSRAMQRATTGNITHERNVMEQLAMLATLKEQGKIKLQSGSIQVRSLNDLLRVMEWEHKLLGGETVEIKIGGGGGTNIPPQVLGAMMSVIKEFVPQDKMGELRERMDEKVFPEFARYATAYQDRQLPAIDVDAEEESSDE